MRHHRLFLSICFFVASPVTRAVDAPGARLFRAPVAVERPVLADAPPRWQQHPIDAFVLRRLRQKGLEPSAQAPPRALVRRLAFDLTGLPPRQESVDRFSAEPTDANWGNIVDELLASPRYGERWARHWLDVARYGESNGFEYNEPRRDAWPYRDWVIRAFNEDMPFDRFARLQIAGDGLVGGEEGAAAVGFLVAGVHNTVLPANPVLKRQARQDELEEIVGTVTQAFLGLTVHCARCHDHKVDPIPTEDYYRVASSLAGVTHGRREVVEPDNRKIRLWTVVPQAPGVLRVHKRGSAANLGKPVAPGAIGLFAEHPGNFDLPEDAPDTERRRKLAEWVTSPSNPLFARVAVNRIWHHHFGRGLVATPNDFGASAEPPSHPDLLDWLALRFHQEGYRVKALHRLIVTSATYRQSAASRREARAKDSDNRLLWRMSPRRMEGEVLRDTLLAVAGVLDEFGGVGGVRGGPGYEDVRERHFNAGRYYDPIDDPGVELNRRSIYRFSPRGARSALYDVFDCPDPSTTSHRRAVTTTPLQALTLQNNRLVWRVARQLAERVGREVGEGIDERITRAWMLVLSRAPDEDELTKARRLVETQDLAALCRVLFNSGELVLIE